MSQFPPLLLENRDVIENFGWRLFNRDLPAKDPHSQTK